MSFTFNKESQKLAKIALAKYPEDRKHSAVMPFLDIAQRQNNNWLSQDCIEYVATQLEMPFIKVWELVTFYAMYNTEPVGKNFVQVCTTTPCKIFRSLADVFSLITRRKTRGARSSSRRPSRSA